MAAAFVPLPHRTSGAGAGLLVLALALASGFAAMGSFSTVQEAAKAELGLSDYALSTVQGLSTALPLALFSVPIGVLVDRRHRLRLLAGLGALWCAGTLLTAVAPDGAWLFLARMLTGIGATGGLTAVLSLTADYSEPARRGRGMLIVTMGKTVGVAAGFALTGVLFGALAAGWWGLSPWRATHLALALIVAVALLPLALLREPPRREAVVAGAPFRVAAAELWSRRRFLLPLFAGQTSVVMADAAAGIWAAPVLTRAYGLSPDRFAGWLGALLLATGVVGTFAGGFVADWGQRSGRRGGLLIGMVAAAAVGVPAALFPIAPGLGGFALGLGLVMLCGTITGLIMSVALTFYLPNEARGLCIGLFIAVAGLLGYGVAPTLVAAVSGWIGGEAKLAPALAIVGVVTGAVSVVALAVAMRRAPAGPTASSEPV